MRTGNASVPAFAQGKRSNLLIERGRYRSSVSLLSLYYHIHPAFARWILFFDKKNPQNFRGRYCKMQQNMIRWRRSLTRKGHHNGGRMPPLMKPQSFRKRGWWNGYIWRSVCLYNSSHSNHYTCCPHSQEQQVIVITNKNRKLLRPILRPRKTE